MSEIKEEKIADKCPKCSDENHEGVFCRSEMRNIAKAKQLRKEGKSPWLNMLKNKESLHGQENGKSNSADEKS